MESKRQRVARLLDELGLPRLVLGVRRHLPPLWLTAIAYHRVTSPAAGLFDHEVCDASGSELAWQLDFLRRWFTPVGAEEIDAWRRGERPLPPNPIVITFDDAYRDNYTHVLPLLTRLGLRATFCIPTRAVDERRVPWWDRIAYVVKASRRTALALDYPEPLRLDLGVHGASRALVAHQLHELVKRRRGLDVERFLDELAAAAEVPWDRALDRRFAGELLMSWDEIRALRAAGMEVASHTRTHRVLATLETSELRDELGGSRRDLEAQLGEPVRALAFPAGEGVAGRPGLRAAVEEAGYLVAFAGRGPHGSTNPLGRDFDPLDIHRVTVERELSPSFFFSMLAIPLLSHPPGVRQLACEL